MLKYLIGFLWTPYFGYYYTPSFSGSCKLGHFIKYTLNIRVICLPNIFVYFKAITRTTTNTSFDNFGSVESWHDVKETLFQLCIVYEYMLCSGMILIQTALVQMHVRHISKGETTVESVIREEIEQHMEIVSYCSFGCFYLRVYLFFVIVALFWFVKFWKYHFLNWF